MEKNDNVHKLHDEEVPEEQVENTERPAKVEVGLHPLGGINIQITDTSGTTAGAKMNLEQTWNIIGHLNALANMLIQAAHQQMAQQRIQEAELLSKLHIPGRNT
jgi:hypothetical protein